MSDQISISDCNKYIKIICNKKSEIEDIKSTIRHIMFIYKNNGIDRVFIDERERDCSFSSIEHLQIATYLSEKTSGLIKFSVLTNEKKSNHDFFKAAVLIKGGLISYFNEKTSALSWLMSESTAC